MASVSKTGGVASDRGGVGKDIGGVGADIPEGATLYDPRKSYSAGEVIWHAGWEVEGTVVDFAPPRSTLNPFPQGIQFRDFHEKVGSESKPVFMDVSFSSSCGNDKRPGVKTLLCNIPVKNYHIPPHAQAKSVGGVTSDVAAASPKGGVMADDPQKGGVTTDFDPA